MPEYEDFDLDRSTAEAWDAFEGRLAEVVSVMDDTSDLTIGSVASDDDTVPFVRFRSLSRDVVRAEAASNGVLGEDYQLGPDQLEALEAAGWRPPTSDGPHPTPNFWVEADQEDSAEKRRREREEREAARAERKRQREEEAAAGEDSPAQAQPLVRLGDSQRAPFDPEATGAAPRRPREGCRTQRGVIPRERPSRPRGPSRRAATSRSTWEAGASGSDHTSGTPVSPACRRAMSRGIEPSRGTS